MKKAIFGLGLFLCGTFFMRSEEEKKERAVTIGVTNSGYIIQEPVSLHFFTKNSLYLVQNEKSKKTHRISRIYGTRLIGLTPDKVTLNYQQQGNPLQGDTVNFLATNSEDNLYVGTEQHPATLYFFTSSFSESSIAMISAQDIHDADGKTTAGIVKLTTGAVVDESQKTDYTFLAVKKHEGHFGEPGSGIAVLRYDPDTKEKEEKENKKEEPSKPFFDILDINLGISKGNRAYGLDLSEGPLSINQGFGSIEYDIVDMHWDASLQRCYVAVCATTKDNARDDQGVCALLVGNVKNKKLFFEPIVSHDVLRGSHSMLGATGPCERVSLHKVRTMTLNNGLKYIVVVGGNGALQETKQQVFAFPLVNVRSFSQDEHAQAFQGTIAKKDAVPFVKSFQNGTVEGRFFVDPVCTIEDFYTSNDLSIQVGGRAPLPGPIHDIAMRGDCVIVTVPEDGNGMAAGAFYSQAIINEAGAVAAWTCWQRIVGGDKKVLHVIPRIGEFRLLSQVGEEQFLSFQKTGWHTPQNITPQFAFIYDQLQACVHEEFPYNTLYGIADYPSTTQGLSGKDAISMIAALGLQKVLLIQTSERDQQGTLRSVYEHDRNTFVKTRTLSFSGGDLADCGALSCSAIGAKNGQAWFFVAGSGGLAVLAQSDGSGWDVQSGLGNRFTALNDTFYFKKLGNYSFIRKLICCGEYLYILTHSSLERISLCAENFGDNACKNFYTESLIHSMHHDTKKIFLNDVIISPDLMIVATSHGLYQGKPDNPATLQKIILPQGEQPIINLFVISRTGQVNDFAHKGQVYVVARSCDYRETYIYRLFVDVCRLEHARVQVIYDCYMKDVPSYWIRYGAPQQGFVTDGISSYSYSSCTATRKAHVSFIPVADLRARSILKEMHSRQLPLGLEKAESIYGMIRNSATGSLLVAADVGLRVNM